MDRGVPTQAVLDEMRQADPPVSYVVGTPKGRLRFTGESEAQQHCPADTVVWVNTPTGIYHFKGMRWYGATIHGAYVCKMEGDQAGYRATRNGQ